MNANTFQAEFDQIVHSADTAAERYRTQLERVQHIHDILSWTTLAAASAVVIRGANSFAQVPSIALIGSCVLFLLITPIDAERELLGKLERTKSLLIELQRCNSGELTRKKLLMLQEKYMAIEADPG